MNQKYRVTLTDDERTLLQDLIASGTAPARTLTHARILLKADQSDDGPAWPDAVISEALEVSGATIARVRECFVEESLEAALHRRPARGHRQRCLDGAQEAHLVALTCSPPPTGHEQWTLRLLADKLVALEYVDGISHETVRQTLKKRTQAVAEGGMVYSAQGERRIRLRHGRCPRRVYAARRPAGADGLL